MAIIGTFKKLGDEFRGEIITLSVQTAEARFVPVVGKAGKGTPSHTVYAGRAEIGAAWLKTAADGTPYLAVELDDPSFNAPIFANLVGDEDGDGHTLTWIRPAKES